MSAFSVRSRGYQSGLILLIISTILFLIGLVSPAWLVYEREIRQIQEEKLFAGVFIGCRYKLRLVGASSFDFTRCSFGFAHAFAGMRDMGDWIHAVEAFEILSAIALIFACMYGVTVNCFTIYPDRRTRILEIISGCAGLVAFIFSMVFVGQLRHTVEGSVFYAFEWAFYLTVVASIAVMVATVIIALFNEYIPRPADFNFSNPSLANSTNPILGSSSFSAAPSTVIYSPHRKAGSTYAGSTYGGSTYGGGGGGGGMRDEDDMYDARVAKVLAEEEEEEEVEEEGGGRRRRQFGRGGERGFRESEGRGGGVARLAGTNESDI